MCRNWDTKKTEKGEHTYIEANFPNEHYKTVKMFYK